MHSDAVDKLLARISDLERLFAALKDDPASPAWREIQRRLAELPQHGRQKPASEPQVFVRGGFGEEMDFACSSVNSYFLALPGWQEGDVNPDEVIYLCGFFAFIALASSPTAPLGRAEAATGARATVARSLLVRRTTPDLFAAHLISFKARLHEYSVLWAGILKGESSLGAFASRLFDNVRVGSTRDGYVEHLTMFPDFFERRIKAFHDSTAPRTDSRDMATAKVGG